MDRQDFAEIKALQLADSIYVVMLETTDGKWTVARDPGLDQPWHTRNKSLADKMAADFQAMPKIRKAEARTLGEAFLLLQGKFSQSVNLHKR